MRLTRTQLRALIFEELTRSSLMIEAEDEGGDAADDIFGGGDEGGDDKGSTEGADEGGDDAADEEGADEEGGAEGSDEGGDEEGGDKEEDAAEGEDEDEESDKKDEKSEEVLGPVGDEVDTALKDVMADFEKRALDSAAAKSKLEPAAGPKKEGRVSLAKLLFESDDEVLIDVGTFASDIARLINNYDTLIDMEGVIYTKAMDFMEKKYGKDYADQLRDTLARDYSIEINVKQDPEKAEQPIYAVGATSSGGAA